MTVSNSRAINRKNSAIHFRDMRGPVHDYADRSTKRMLLVGLRLLWLQSHLGSADFEQGMRVHGISHSIARPAIRIATLLLLMDSSVARGQLLDLEPTKIRELARVAPTDLADAIRRGDLGLNDVSRMSCRSLRAEMRRLRGAPKRAV